MIFTNDRIRILLQTFRDKDGLAPDELHAQLIKPIQQITRWHLLMEQLVKVTESTNPHYDELKAGWEAAKRMVAEVNEAKRTAENQQAVVELSRRVEDWKGHDVQSFGPLLLEDTFHVLKSDTEREYRVYLFERMILCCKEVKAKQANMMSSNKRHSAKRKPDLALKGRIYITNVESVQPLISPGKHISP